MRKRTSELLELMDNGYITAEEIVCMCMQYMSEDDVADMMHDYQIIEDVE